MKTLTNPIGRWLLSGLFMAASLAVQAQTESAPGPEAARIQATAEDAYIYGLPLVSTYAVLYAFSVDSASPQFKAPINQLGCMAKPATPADKAIPFVNNDTLYCNAWLDLRAEPMVISVPAVEKSRYHSVMLTDLSSVNFGLIGTNTTGNAAGDFLVVGPDWQGETPAGIKGVYRATSLFSNALFRTQLKNLQDIDGVRAVQAGYRVRSLSNYLGTATPPAAAQINFPKIDRELAKSNFFGYLNFVLGLVPVRPEDRELRERIAAIGLGSGNFDTFKAIAAKYRPQLMAGVQAGDAKINALIAKAGPRVNGWNWNFSLDSDRDNYTGDYLKRAALARAAPFGLNADEARYPISSTLANGEPLDASKHNYSLTFKAGELPPVEQFWSLTMYDAASRSFVENPLQRYNINSGSLPQMQKNADGSLTIYLQKDSPGADKQANWLPAPDAPFSVILRLYGISETLKNNAWVIPPVMLAD